MYIVFTSMLPCDILYRCFFVNANPYSRLGSTRFVSSRETPEVQHKRSNKGAGHAAAEEQRPVLRDREGRAPQQGHDPEVVGGVHKVPEERGAATEGERGQAEADRVPQPEAAAADTGAGAAGEVPRAAGLGLHVAERVRLQLLLLLQGPRGPAGQLRVRHAVFDAGLRPDQEGECRTRSEALTDFFRSFADAGCDYGRDAVHVGDAGADGRR